MSEPGRQSQATEDAKPIGLTSRYERNLDPKKRLTIPSAWRNALGPDAVYVMPDTEQRCLQLIPKKVWELRLEELRKRPLSDAELNSRLSVIGENSELLEFDVQGRIRISDRLLAYADLKESVVMKGAIRMATIWPADKCAPEAAVDTNKLREAMKALDF